MSDKKQKKHDAFTPEEQTNSSQYGSEADSESADDVILSDDTENTDNRDIADDIHSDAENPEKVSESENTAAHEEEGRGKTRKRRRRRRRQKKERMPLGRKPFIIAGCIVGGLAVIYLGISAFFISHFYMNTVINGHDFSGKTAADVEEYIKQQVSDYKLTVREQNNETSEISGADISLSYEANDEIENALKSQNPFLWPSAFFAESTTDVTVQVSYDEEALNEQIQSLNAVTREQTQPVSASPEYNGESYEVKAEVYGTSVDIDVLTEKVKQYISEFRDELVLRDEGCYVLPAYTSSSPEVQEACDTMNKYIQASITYTMDDEDVVVDKDLISEWLSCDSEMQVTLDEDAVRQWMREFGKKYDTVGTTRTITTPTGKKAEVTGGTYGWSVNEDGETQTLIQNIKNGDVTSKKPAYKQTAASHSEQDWGNTYLEVDLSTQHMWYIKDGSVVLETDVVTGRPTDDRETPQGVYSIIEMKRDKVLTGSIDPATGEPSYRTPVSYWMRITWTGIGFHDATWQAQFGGDWYINHGSHGCINMPLSKASQLYEMLEMGTPAIVHY